MPKTTDNSLPDLAEVQRKGAELAAKIEELRQMPERLRKEEEERRNTLPPFDLLEDKKREKAFDQKVSMGEIKNARQDFTRSSLLTILLLITSVVLLWWAYRELLRLGIL
jgi:hypothetical protein